MSEGASSNPHQKRRGRRRGSRKNKRKHWEEPPKTTRWSALERTWFLVDGDNVSSSKDAKTPEPLLAEDVMAKSTNDSTSDSLDQLRHLWGNFCKKRQRPNIKSSSCSSVWQPRPIQLQSWSILMPRVDKHSTGVNMIGLSPTASGKTAAFGIPMVCGARQESLGKAVLAKPTIYGIVLLPTRELAQQVAKELEIMVSSLPKSSPKSSESGIHVMACSGGGSQSALDQINILQKAGACQWLICATPGRLSDIVQKCQAEEKEKSGNKVNIQPRYICLDECDRLASNVDLGQQVSSILKTCLSSSPNARLAFFSATYPEKVSSLWKDWMNLSNTGKCALIRVDAVSLETSNTQHKKHRAEAPSKKDVGSDDEDKQQSAANQEIEKDVEEPEDEQPSSRTDSSNKIDFLSRIPAYLVQTLHVCAEHKKAKKLISTLDKIRKEEQSSQYRQKRLGVIFFGRIKTLQYISKLLKKQPNHSCLELHSQLPQHVRSKNMQTFQSGRVPVLLATDIAARGLHVNNIGFVINYDFPSNLEQYVHRCGRAGRNHPSSAAQATSDGNDAAPLPPTIYSFFTRSLAPLAPDLVSLLRACKAWVDPNLLALVKGGNNEATQGKPKDDEKPTTLEENNQNDHGEGELSEEDAFPELSAKRIVLKRASNVSDASSSEDEDNGD